MFDDNYFVENQRISFERENYNYNLIPTDIRSNSYLEKYNKDIEDYISENKEYNWAFLLGFINSEISRIQTKLITEHIMKEKQN